MTTDVIADDAALRRARRQRVLDEMDAADIDVLVVGREANARYVSGVPRLWLAGTRPFGPGCVLVRSTGAVHLMSTWDEGVPEDIPHEHLYGITFDATNFVCVLRDVDGAADARTVATDALNGGAEAVLPQSFPNARLVDGAELLGRSRRVKTPEEVEAIRASVAVAEASLAASVAALEPGVTARQLTGVFMEAMASAGVTTPSTQDVAWVASREHHGHRRADRDTPVEPGDLVSFEAGVLRDGYLGEVGRTCVAGTDDDRASVLFGRRDALWDRLLDACRPGATGTDLLDAYATAGEARPPMPVARGLGLGFDLPLVTHDLPTTAAAERLEAGMVLALTTYVWEEGVGASYGQEPVLIGADGPRLLSTTPFRAR